MPSSQPTPELLPYFDIGGGQSSGTGKVTSPSGGTRQVTVVPGGGIGMVVAPRNQTAARQAVEQFVKMAVDIRTDEIQRVIRIIEDHRQTYPNGVTAETIVDVYRSVHGGRP